ncbi:MAG: ATP-binding cassette domain-containing protein [Clostridia bacterium]
MDEIVLEMQGLTKEFPGVKALDNVSLTVRRGTVHALMGENGAGKSTLMKCLFGIYQKDCGKILLNGSEVNFSTPRQAMESGVAMVHQELNQVLKRNIMDNMWLGRFPTRGGIVSKALMYRQTKDIFDELNINLDPNSIMEKLSVSSRQMVEIAKAVSYGAKVLVLDEPTSSLSDKEVEHLFAIIDKLKSNGCGIIYISHKMDEILRISDDVTIMRDGKLVATHSAKNLAMSTIIKEMVGRDLSRRFPPKTNIPQEKVIFQVKNLCGKFQPTVCDISFELRKGEILGIAGLVGARRTELLETIFGIRQIESGQILYDGKVINEKKYSVHKAHKCNFALLTEERRANGIFDVEDISFNSVIATLGDCRVGGMISNRKIKLKTAWVINSMRVKTPSQKTIIKSLSGGNQQKVILGRWLLKSPEILLLDEPTRGIDIGAKYEIYQLIIDLANQGKSIIMVSSELPELLGVSDKIMVMSNGRASGIVNTKDTSQEELMTLASKFV